MSKKSKTKSKSTDSEQDKLAVFLCECGSNIADTIDIDSLRRRYESIGIPLVEVDDHLCSEQGVSDFVSKIKKSKAKRVVIAGCSPLLHKELFSDAVREAGVDPGHLQMANIREQCSWVHYDDPESATKKAAAIIDTGIAKVRGSNPIPTRGLPMTQRAMVIGGGVAGLTAALELADAGIETVIVEREGFLGGHMAKWDKLFPTFDCSICILGPMMARASRHPHLRIMTLSHVTDVRGNVGNYRVTVKQMARYVDIESCTGCNRCIEVCPVDVVDEYNNGLGTRKAMVRPTQDSVPIAPYIDTTTCIGCQSCAGVCEPQSLRFEEEDKTEVIEVGAVILATGFRPFDPRIVEEFGYGKNPDVITSVELERLINPEGPSGGMLVRPSDGEPPKNIVFVPCVGSRSERFERPYCSRVCCTAAVKEVMQVKQKIPDCDAYVFYTDLRVFGKGHEELYERAAREYRVNFVRGAIGEVVLDPISNKTTVRAEDTLARKMMEFEVDLVVLMVGMDAEPSNIELSRLFKAPLDENGFFLERHPKLAPSSTASKGVFLAGVSQGPKDIADSVAHAGLAASKVKTLLASGEIITEACVPSFNIDLCISCRLCEDTCTPKAIKFNDEKVPEVDLAACRACGACVAACPTDALDLPCLTNEQLEDATKAAVQFNPLRPAIVGYLCRWCAYSAADRAGVERLKYPPNIVSIQVPCTGRLNADTILTAFAEGADGVAILGCHVQDCHYRSGARYAMDRTDKIRKVLKAAGIDGRRLYFGSASAGEAGSFAEQVTRFTNDIVRLGPLGKEIAKNQTKSKDAVEATGR
ncbi:MAG: hydrogenase iron-sulfur subunit [Promethearchaeota archaeon]